MEFISIEKNCVTTNNFRKAQDNNNNINEHEIIPQITKLMVQNNISEIKNNINLSIELIVKMSSDK